MLRLKKWFSGIWFFLNKKYWNSSYKEIWNVLIETSSEALPLNEFFFLDSFKNEDALSFYHIYNELGNLDSFPSFETIYSNELCYDEACFNFRAGFLNKNEYDNCVKMIIDANIVKKVIRCRNIEDFTRVVNLLPLDDSRKKYYIEHEHQHAEIAKSIWLDFYYLLSFSKVPINQDGLFHIRPSVAVLYPDEMPFLDYCKAYLRIAESPWELSENDLAQVKMLKDVRERYLKEKITLSDM